MFKFFLWIFFLFFLSPGICSFTFASDFRVFDGKIEIENTYEDYCQIDPEECMKNCRKKAGEQARTKAKQELVHYLLEKLEKEPSLGIAFSEKKLNSVVRLKETKSEIIADNWTEENVYIITLHSEFLPNIPEELKQLFENKEKQDDKTKPYGKMIPLENEWKGKSLKVFLWASDDIMLKKACLLINGRDSGFEFQKKWDLQKKNWKKTVQVKGHMASDRYTFLFKIFDTSGNLFVLKKHLKISVPEPGDILEDSLGPYWDTTGKKTGN